MPRAVANTLLPAARPASTIARPRPRELPVTNHTCAIHPPVSKPTTSDILEKLLNLRIGCAMVYERTCRTQTPMDCGPCQRTPQRSKEGRKSSTSFSDGSDFLRTIAPSQHVVRSNASLVESCPTEVPFSM